MKKILMTLVVLLVGCAAQSYVDRVEQAIQDKQWEAAYRSMEDGFASNRPERKSKVATLFISHPEIRSAAASTFSPDSLSKSRVRYGDRISWEIESNRLQLYMQAASTSDYEIAKTNIERSFSEIYKQNAERKRLEQLSEVEKQKLADEKHRADEAEKTRRVELILQSQRALATAAEKAYFLCKDRVECDKAFSLTQIFIVSNSDMKIQVANDTIIETYNASERMKVAMKAIKMPRAGSTAVILLSLSCKDEGNESLKNWCDTKSLRIYSEFPQFMQKNLIQ